MFWAHKSPKRDENNPADLQNRVNSFYQNCRGSDVAYVTTHVKNPRTMLWSTSPTNRMGRGEASKKDIAKMPVVRKKSKIFRGYSKPVAPAHLTFSAKAHTDKKQVRHLMDLQR